MAQDDLTGAIRPAAVLVEAGWTSSYFIRNTGGDTYRVLCWPDGRMGFKHRCRIIDGTQLIVAPGCSWSPAVTGCFPLTRSPSSRPSCAATAGYTASYGAGIGSTHEWASPRRVFHEPLAGMS